MDLSSWRVLNCVGPYVFQFLSIELIYPGLCHVHLRSLLEILTAANPLIREASRAHPKGLARLPNIYTLELYQ